MKDNNSDEEYYDANDQSTAATSRFLEESSPPVKEPAGPVPPANPQGISVDSPLGKDGASMTRHPLLAHIVRRETTRQDLQTSDQCHPPSDNRTSKNKLPFTSSDDRSKPAAFLSKFGLKKRDTKRDSSSKVNQVVNDSTSDDSLKSLPELYNSTEDINIDTISRHGSPPPHGATYIKVNKSRRKPIADLTRLVLAQTLTNEQEANIHAHRHQPCDAIWTMKFSKDGTYLATGGQRCIVQVWKVLGMDANDNEKKDHTIKVFDETLVNEFAGHTADILDLSWSKNNFLLSSSMDKTVRLWHVSRKECLCVFRHLDFVTALEFHPKDDRYFLSGSLDCKIRLWSIPDKKVSLWNEMPNENMVTAVGFTLDARTICAGTHTGQCFLFETQGLKYITEITGGSQGPRGSRKGRKITGVEAMPGMRSGEEKLLVTSNDSKIRLYDLQNRSLILSYRGVENMSMQIKATFSDDGLRVICGSEDCCVYTWNAQPPTYSPFHLLQESGIKAAAALGNLGNQLMHNKDEQGQPTRLSVWLKRGEQHVLDRFRNRNEHYEAHDNVVTVAIFAPTRTRQRLAQSMHDTVYNHTPMINNDSSSITAGQYGDYMFTEGPIIVSSDSHGCIKVWRKDSGVYDTAEPIKKPESMSKSHTIGVIHRQDTPFSVKNNQRLSGLLSFRRPQ